MAEARTAVAELHVDREDEGRIVFAFKLWRKAAVKRLFRAWNSLCNGVWPTPVYNIAVTTGVFSTVLLTDWEWTSSVRFQLYHLGDLLHIHTGLPRLLRIPLISMAGGFSFFVMIMYARRWFLRMLLSYRGWMFEALRSTSLMTKFWCICVRLVSGYSPTTYSCQRSLPGLPLPSLHSTVTRFMTSIQPICPPGSAEYQQFEVEAQEFEKELGPYLQRRLLLKSYLAPNWVTDWWEKYIYLMYRSPIAINSNYYILDENNWTPTHRQVSRASFVINSFLRFKRLIDREQLEPLVVRDTVPLCMYQYERLFSTTRVPHESIDNLIQFPHSRHITVFRKGLMYCLDGYDKLGNILTPKVLEQELQWIVDDADQQIELGNYNPDEALLPSLTAWERTKWANARSQHLDNRDNQDSLKVLEESIFYVVLDTVSYDSMTARGKHLLHGRGADIWFDKSISIVVFEDGKYGTNEEHSYADALIAAHLTEFTVTEEIQQYANIYDDDGFCKVSYQSNYKQAAVKQPFRLVWNISLALSAVLKECYTLAKSNNDDLDLCIEDFRSYGKGFMKTCKVSPDAYIQLALQLTYYRLEGKLALTYEAATTRLYLMGRTETVRSLSCETAQCVKNFEELRLGNSKDRETLTHQIRVACDKHQYLYKAAMTGDGLDRHLFGLYVACKGLGKESPFLSHALHLPWILSTSQQPQQQMKSSPDCNDRQYDDKVSPGGGFGPVADNGYGVSYMIPGDHRIFFHVSSKHSAPKTDSKKFMDCLFKTLSDIKDVFTSVKN